ncbi:MAG TPA: hypothetical protein VHZ78_02605 [Rhizomicrobium sp.]|jgi:hypothetical protein|nr:hypothetical protein [Rhizomicrobium sp.]
MPVTVVNEDSATIVSDENDGTPRFSWSAAFAGAFVATAVTLFLLTLGSGVGLSLVSVRHATANGTMSFFTAGAIYFLVAQAFGFAAGGHIVGRMIGPALETDREEEFRAGTHGLVAWALAVVATATLVALSVLVAGSATANGAAVGGALASSAPMTNARGDANANVATSYWVDTLFRSPMNGMQASLGWTQYAQNDTGTATDGSTAPPPADPSAMTPSDTDTAAPGAGATVHTNALPPVGSDTVITNGTTATAPPTALGTTTIMPSTPRSIGADKAEAGRILTVGMANGGHLTADDHTQIARLVAQDTGLTLGAAQSRVTDVENRIRQDEAAAAETARKTAAYASLWTAFALLFGAVVAVAAAISARWEADKEAGFLPGTRVESVRL